MRYGQTGTIRVNECGEFFEFRPDGSARYVPVGRSEFYCPALGDDMDGEKAVRKVQP
jgi:hypothetical protein